MTARLAAFGAAHLFLASAGLALGGTGVPVTRTPACVVLPDLPAAPDVDGMLKVGEWEGAHVFPDFFGEQDHRPAAVRTRVLMGRHGGFLYLAAVCDPSNGETGRPGSSAVWDRDHVEFRIWSLDEERGIVIAWDGGGDFVDARQAPGWDPSWDSRQVSKASRDSTGWRLEARVPIDTLAAAVPRSGGWRLKLVRDWRMGLESSVIEGDPADPFSRPLLLVPSSGEGIACTGVAIEEEAVPTLVVSMENRRATEASVRLEVRIGGIGPPVVNEEAVSIGPGQTRRVTIPLGALIEPGDYDVQVTAAAPGAGEPFFRWTTVYARTETGSPAADDASWTNRAVDVHLDPAVQHQKMDGIGAGAIGFDLIGDRRSQGVENPAGTTFKTSTEQRRQIMEMAVRMCGCTHARIWATRNSEPTNDNDDPEQIDWSGFRFPAGPNGEPTGVREILDLAVPMGLSNWVPTGGVPDRWMLPPGGEKLDPALYSEYAEWLTAEVLRLKRETGMEASYVSVFNEPNQKDFMPQGEGFTALVKAVGRRFRKEGIASKLVVPDDVSIPTSAAKAATVMSDPKARSYVGALAYHHYWSRTEYPRTILGQVRKGGRVGDLEEWSGKTVVEETAPLSVLAKTYGVPLWMTEGAYYLNYTKGLPSWEIGLARANEIHCHFAEVGASAYEAMHLYMATFAFQRHGGSNDGGRIVNLGTDGTHVNDFWITRDTGFPMAHYGRFVRPGDARIDAACEDPLFRVSAYRAPDGRRVSLVVINNSRTWRRFRISERDLPFAAGYIMGVITTGTAAFEPLPVSRASGVVSADLAPSSISSFAFAMDAGTLEGDWK